MNDLQNHLKNQDLDPDIVQSRNDVLRAKDIYPPFNQPKAEQPHTNQTKTFPVPDFDEPDKGREIQNTETANDEKHKPDNGPIFDIASRILEKQRRSSSMLRRGPGQKETPAENLPVEEDEIQIDGENPCPEEIKEPVLQEDEFVQQQKPIFEDDQTIDSHDEIIEHALAEDTTEEKQEKVEIEDITQDNDFTEFEDGFDDEVDGLENYNIQSHVSTITKLKLTKSQEALINDIVARDIEQFLMSA